VRSGHLEVAEKHLTEYFQAGASDAGVAAYELLQELLVARQQGDQLIPRLQQLREAQPDDVYLLYFLGEQFRLGGRQREAIEIFQQIMKVRPLLEGYRSLATIYLQQDAYRSLLMTLADAAGRLNGLDPLQDVVAQVAADEQAVAEIRNLVSREVLGDEREFADEQRNYVSLAAAMVLEVVDDVERADQLLELALNDMPAESADSIALAWAMRRLVGNHPDLATKILQRLIEKDPNHPQLGPLHFYLSASLALDEQYEEALSAARKAAELAMDVPAIQLRPGWVLFLAERWPQSRQEYLRFLARFEGQYGSPNVRETVKEAKSTLSSIEVFLDQPEVAEEWLEQVLDEFPGDVGALNDLGYLWADRGVHLQRALRMTQQAVEAQPDNAAYRDSYGWALYQLARYEEAVVQLRVAVQAEEPDGVVLDHLGDTLLQTDGPAAAVVAWRRALEALGDKEPARRAKIKAKLTEYEAE
jgi:tetratricopeptide (TPR) repeat protein